jgi:2-hydroxychromene-2-carboxylate isomerase
VKLSTERPDPHAGPSSASSPRLVRFYFDYESPNAYLAWTQLPKLAERQGCAIEAVAVLYAGLLEAHGQLGPGEVPAKGRWMTKNLARKAAMLKIALNPPAFMPFNPLLALRVSLVPVERAEQWALIDALFNAVWVRGLHVSEPAIVECIANEVDLDGTALVRQALDPEIKSRLRRQTDEAISRGVFGVPSMLVGDELFWGYDDFPHLESFLMGQDPLDPKQWQKWSTPVQPSSVRRRFRTDAQGS